MKLRLRPIHVYCMHHVCAEFDAESMHEGDWMQIDDFKRKIQTMRQDGVEFISLSDAYRHICEDKIRRSKYAVITFDDGYASTKEILLWLRDLQIPVTLFINPAYMDGKHYREKENERYLTKEDIARLLEECPLLTIGSHGWEHKDNSKMELMEFANNLDQAYDNLRCYNVLMDFYAYPNGKYSRETDALLHERKICPLRADGLYNIDDKTQIHREYFPQC